MCSLLSCAGGQAACLHHFYHILHLSCDALESLAAAVVGRTWQLQGFEGWSGGHPRSCQVWFLCLCLDAAARD